MKKTKLELTWIGKDETPSLEPRILIEDPEKSYKGKKPGLTDNRVIFGDNLLALKALEQEFAGRIKCVYIDPPFNTGQAFPEYDDGIEHSLWLSLLAQRLRLLHTLLREDGALFVEIDDTESSYLQVLLDEIFGRPNRIATVCVKRSAATGHKAINPSPVNVAEYIHVYAKDKSQWRYKPTWVARGDYDWAYKTRLINPEEHFSSWRFEPLSEHVASRCGYADTREAKKALGKSAFDTKLVEFALGAPSEVVRFAQPNYQAVSKAAQALIDESKANPDRVLRLERDAYSDMYFLAGNRILFLASKVEGDGDGAALVEPLTNWWDDIPWQGIAREGGVAFPKNKKPERLIQRILGMCTEPGDWVLDSFAGSGTTGAVAQKMGRQWIIVELGEHCHSLVLPRLRSVIDGEDPGGITETVGWKGGGGFRYYRLGPSLLEKDAWGNWIISEKYNAPMLAEALCKLEGFRFDPDPDTYFIHGRSSERDFLYATTQTLTFPQLERLSKNVGKKRSLLVMCGAYKATPAQLDTLANLTVRKIPQAVLSRCEFGKDDYSLKLPERDDSEGEADAETDTGPQGTSAPEAKKKRAKKTVPVQSLPLFDRQAAEKADKKGGRS